MCAGLSVSRIVALVEDFQIPDVGFQIRVESVDELDLFVESLIFRLFFLVEKFNELKG